jgi:hypothetical protein
MRAITLRNSVIFNIQLCLLGSALRFMLVSKAGLISQNFNYYNRVRSVFLMKSYILLILLLPLATCAHAYVGPGLAAGTTAVIVGILISIILAVFALFWYPIKRILKIGKRSKKELDENEE